MSFKDGEMHVMAAFGAAFLSAALFVPTVWMADARADHTPVLEEMEAIEASIAVKKAPAMQPQKKTQAKPAVVKPDGVSRDETKVVDDKSCKQDSDCPAGRVCVKSVCKLPDKVAKTETDPLGKFRRPTDDETPTGKPTTEVGTFNDNERGFAEETKGHPFFQKVARDFVENFEYPKILAGESATGCIHLLADGKIAKFKVDPKSGEATLDDAVERALKKMQTLRASSPEAPPIELLKQATTRWICFNTGKLQRAE
ncbi:MAG: TonB C-terminal domain-containing protein [Deltaproteobacteria bacterium]|nr:TonB C-terminal domain-containing protein [Deltaproteobacteria bacterium]MDQ3297105.1 TonB C-terminal domain-containing protein [Myxococcota bacterium]